MNALEVRDLAKSFGRTRALDGVSFAVPAGGFFTIVGPTNAGKSTLLKTIAGLHEPDRGDIFISGRHVNGQEPRLRRVSAYATARNLLEKTPEELRTLRELGLGLLYIGPESGDDVVLKRIAKGATAREHVEAARKAHEAGMKLSVIFLLGAGGVDRSAEHARASAELATAMDPRFVSLLTLPIFGSVAVTRYPPDSVSSWTNSPFLSVLVLSLRPDPLSDSTTI